MKKTYLISFKIFALVCALSLVGCEKFLDEKSDKKLAIPYTLTDFQALLDNSTYIIGSPSSGEISADDYYLSHVDWTNLALENHRRMYIWEKDNLFAPNEIENDWQYVYTTIYYANTVLEGLAKIAEKSTLKDNIKGQAHYIRANSYFDAAIVWTLAYDESTASKDLGLPLRLSTNFNEVSKRSSIRETYQLIIDDLKQAIKLLPATTSSKFRASKTAAYGMLARTYLAMRDYKQAHLYADSSLMLYNKIIDYNTLITSSNYPITLNNDEVIFYKGLRAREPIAVNKAKILPALYESYSTNDLRKVAFFQLNSDNSYRFKGSYRGSSSLFSGIATNEMYLIRAECAIRLNLIPQGVADLNYLMENRYKKNNGISTFRPVQTNDVTQLLQTVLTERRKELLMRGIRWMDIKRLNKEGRNISLTRNLSNNTYELPANDPRFALAIPETVIDISGMEQNFR